jgi:hypothetical protein
MVETKKKRVKSRFPCCEVSPSFPDTSFVCAHGVQVEAQIQSGGFFIKKIMILSTVRVKMCSIESACVPIDSISVVLDFTETLRSGYER